jgi:hypothetical protein
MSTAERLTTCSWADPTYSITSRTCAHLPEAVHSQSWYWKARPGSAKRLLRRWRSATQRSKVHVIAWGQILSVEAKYCDSRPQGLGGLQLLLGSGVLLARPVAAAHTASPG